MLIELARIARFSMVASVAAMIHLSIAEILVLTHTIEVVLLANLIAFCPAVVFSYWGQRAYAFKTNGNFCYFLGLALAGFVLNNLVLLFAISCRVPPALSLLLAALGSPVLMYVGCRRLVFNPRSA